MKKFFNHLLSDTNKVSSKRFIGLLSLIMFMAYGIKALFLPFNLEFWIFYISLCVITIWIAFRFMSSEKALKYNILGQLSQFGLKKSVDTIIDAETNLDGIIQPDVTNSETPPVEELPENQ